MTRRPLLAAVAALVAALALAGCGSDDTGGTLDLPGGTVPATPAPGGIDPMDDAATTPVSTPPRDGRALLTQVRAARHEGFDRVTFEFEDGLPGYRVSYADGPVHADGSGEVVDVDGDHAVVVRMEVAGAADIGDGGELRRTYTGPNRLEAATPVVAELVRAGDFEGVLTWVVGLRDKVDFRVTRLATPARLVVDFRNH